MSVYNYLIISFLQYLFTRNQLAEWVWKDLIYKFSYKYSVTTKSSFRIILTYCGQAVRKIFNKNPKKVTISNKIILDQTSKGIEQRVMYLKEAIGKEINCSFAISSDTVETNYIEKMLLLGITSFLYFWVFIFSVFSKRRAQIGLIPVETLQLFFLSKYIKKTGAKEVYFFSPYEKDTCFITHYLKNKMGLKVILFPSPNPISNFYKRVICSTFAFSVPYQNAELYKLKHQWEVEECITMPPAGFHEIIKTKGRETPKNSIGFLSSGNWLRKLKSRSDAGKGYLEAENNLIVFLKAFLEKHDNIQLLIYLHPIEKSSSEVLTQSKQYFVQHFGGQIIFADPTKPSKIQPELVDVALSPYSSAMFERLYGGYKVMFSQKGMKDNYFNDDRLMDITANNQEDFNEKLVSVLEMSALNFIEKYQLKEYVGEYET